MKALVWLACLPLLGACAAVAPFRLDATKELAPTGKLRAAINFGNPVLAQKDPTTGAPRGVSVDLARELGRRLGVPVELVTFDAAGKVFDALGTGAWDVAFLAIEPVRAAQISFTAPYVHIEGTYLVRTDSPLRAIGDFDRDGVRIAVGNKSAYDLYLSRTLKRAHLVRAPTAPASIELFVKERLDSVAGVEQPLHPLCSREPGLSRDRGALHADRAGHGHSAGPRGRRALPARVRRGDESVRVRRACTGAQRPARRDRRAAGALETGRACQREHMTTDAWPRIAVVGAGAVGCYYGGMLARAGEPVMLIGRPAHVEAIRRTDFASTPCSGRRTSRSPRQRPERRAGRGRRPPVRQDRRHRRGGGVDRASPPGAAVVSLQNGVDNAARMRPLVTAEVLAAVVYVGCQMAGPGHVRHTGRGDLVLGGQAGSAAGARRAAAVAAVFERAGVPCKVSPNVDGELWTKLIINCAYNAVSALARLPTGR